MKAMTNVFRMSLVCAMFPLFLALSPSMAYAEFVITTVQTESEFEKADLAPPNKGDCEDYDEGGVLRMIKGVWNYGSCLLVSVPKINQDILEIKTLAAEALAEQKLKDATEADLKKYDDACHALLQNIRTHEIMVHNYADKHLFFGKSSPVLESHSEAKTQVDKQLDKIRVAQEKLQAKLASARKEEGDAQIRKNSGKSFARMLELHSLLWNGSAQYREMLQSVNRQGEKVTLLDRNEAIAAYKAKGDVKGIETITAFRFRAQWNSVLRAVVVMDPPKREDHDLGSVIAFELTNAFQNPRFDSVQKQALEGAFDDLSIRDAAVRSERGAERYMHAMEQIENDGRTLHDKIIDEAIKSGTVDKDWHWSQGHSVPAYERLFTDLIATEYGQDHMKYWRDSYLTSVAPYVEKQRQENVSQRMKILREKQRSL